MMTLAEYLLLEVSRGVFAFALRPRIEPNGTVAFLIHPLDRDGVTRDYLTTGSVVEPDPRVRYESES